jgi:hypothetical protein
MDKNLAKKMHYNVKKMHFFWFNSLEWLFQVNF